MNADSTKLIKTFLARTLIISGANYLVYGDLKLLGMASLKEGGVGAAGSMISQYWVEPMWP